GVVVGVGFVVGGWVVLFGVGGVFLLGCFFCFLVVVVGVVFLVFVGLLVWGVVWVLVDLVRGVGMFGVVAVRAGGFASLVFVVAMRVLDQQGLGID
ncbi:hypothetical protein RA269_28125, partial [Pseudomonas syringae pv. tagetis]|uniref:hypothetical protein n=1 Tax=Pseudomonas syringae group genomosp. 7 TaxID=251699 RepID=UPI0037703A53